LFSKANLLSQSNEIKSSMKFFLSKDFQSLTNVLRYDGLKDFLINNICGKWSEIPVVRFPESISNLTGDVKILSIRVLDSGVILVGRVIWGEIK